MSSNIISKCLTCGEVFKKPLGWYKRTKKCPKCAGELDAEPVRKLAKDAIERLQKRLTSKS